VGESSPTQSPQLRDVTDAADGHRGAGAGDDGVAASVDAVDLSKKGHFAYFFTKEFYIILVLG
jgi:hypothetical protein